MTAKGQTLEDQVQELALRVQVLEGSLEKLTARLAQATPVELASAQTEVKTRLPPVLDEPADVSEEMLSWAGRNALLPRVSTICFLLVVALILRTITDSGMINKLLGSALGMGFAATLMIVGWQKYARSSPLAPVFAACGAILMSTIVVETHTHFKSLPLVPAYLTLMATGIGMAFISRRFNAFTPISFGILGMCLAGAAIDYPHPHFPYLSLVLWTANLLGFMAARLKRCSWLRWIVMLVSMVMLQLWAFRIGVALRQGIQPPPELADSLFLPVLGVFALTYLLLALFGIIQSGTERVSRFDQSLPVINVLWAFSSAFCAMYTKDTPLLALGIVGIMVALLHLGASFWLARRAVIGVPGTAAFTFACGALLALALPVATGKLILSLPALSLIGIFMAIFSREWNNGSVRAVTYLFHIYSCAALFVAVRGDSPQQMDAVNILPAILLSCIMVYQYLWCRWWPPPPGSSILFKLDEEDRSAVMLLLAGLLCGFLAMRIGIFQVVQLTAGAGREEIFRCAQSVLINGAAVFLMVWGFMRRDREIRNVAIMVTLIGAGKVFLYDLLGTHGLPLVCSVFSFGAAAAVESVVLGKWPKAEIKPVQEKSALAAANETVNE